MISKPFLLTWFLIAILLNRYECTCSQVNNWTHLRGNNLSGISETDVIPLKWDEASIEWKTEIHDIGHSSPVIFENQVWLTTAKATGTELYAVCIDFQSGKIIHDIKVFTPEKPIRKHSLNSYATPTPCIEKGYVYVHYGSQGTACLRTTDGSILWQRTDLVCNHVQGPASSPVLYKNLIILHYEGVDVRFIVALDKRTGKQVWRTDRPLEPYLPLTEIGRKAYITPLIINVKGSDMMISNGSAVTMAYDPNTGKEIWRVVRGAESTVAIPFTENGIVYWYTGFMVDPDGSNFTEIMAVNPDGKGDITTSNVVWRKKSESMQLLTPVIRDGLIYTIDTKNNLICIDASSGKDIWSAHLRSNHNASPLYINGNVWFFSVRGEVMAIRAGRKYDVMAQNQMDSGIWATPAVLRNSLILRTERFLYKIRNP